MNAQELFGLGEKLFSDRSSLILLWQEMAENFYAERADFTYSRSLGTDFAGNMMTSYPMMVRRDLGDQVGQMLRPTNKEFAHLSLRGQSKLSNDAQRYLEWFARTQRRAMYDRRAQFVDSEKMADHDYSSFGQSVTQVQVAKSQDRLLFQNWHLRDVAWQHNAEREICAVFRKNKMHARDIKNTFKNVHADVTKCLTGSNPKPFEEFECMHMVVMSDLFDDKAPKGMEWRSIWYDCKHQHVMESVAIPDNEYVIARWMKPGASQYAFSPASVCALPEARLIQAITYTLVEAGEKIVNPPLIAVDQAVRSDINVYAGGVTWADRDYDEKTGEVLRPMNIDAKGMPLGMQMIQDSRAMIMQAFYLNKLNLPQRAAEMTAYEVGQRVQEYIRGALPLFEPMEYERNGQVWEKAFHILRRRGAFGSELDWPKELRVEDIEYTFESPLHDAIDAVKGAKFLESQQYVAAAMQLDQTAGALVDAKAALRDVLQGVKAPALWVRSEIAVQKIDDQRKAAEQSQATLAQMQQGSEVVGNLAAAQKDTAMAGMTQ